MANNDDEQPLLLHQVWVCNDACLDYNNLAIRLMFVFFLQSIRVDEPHTNPRPRMACVGVRFCVNVCMCVFACVSFNLCMLLHHTLTHAYQWPIIRGFGCGQMCVRVRVC